MHAPDAPLTVADEVREALVAGRPVVALESTIISHLVVAAPIPAADALAADYVNRIVEAAIGDADARGIRGSARTPFVLDQIRVRTEGRSVAANTALVRHNVEVATAIAVVLVSAWSAGPVRSFRAQRGIPAVAQDVGCRARRARDRRDSSSLHSPARPPKGWSAITGPAS